jgi:hypothetical protein
MGSSAGRNSPYDLKSFVTLGDLYWPEWFLVFLAYFRYFDKKNKSGLMRSP